LSSPAFPHPLIARRPAPTGILNVFESEHFRLPRRSMKVLRETEVSLAFGGGNNVGMLALFHAAQATIKKAAAHGIALVSVTDAWMSGRGALLPFGGYKGFGLALMMQALGLLAGSGLDSESDYGYLFVAFRPDLFGPADTFERR
jgi:LDH2 family malate/lactate/ureidoglycolate dehydrogenase